MIREVTHVRATMVVALAVLAVSLGAGMVSPGLTDAAGGDRVSFQSAASTSPVALIGYLYRPEGPGPFPAMVLLHTCAGLSTNQHQWGEWFRTRLYAALVVDSFSPRHQNNVCGVGKNPSLSEVGGDASGALAYLRSLPFVDGQRIGVIGWSYGAMAIILATRTLAADGARAGVSLYPACLGPHLDLRPMEPAIPVLLLIGSLDDDGTPAPCVEWAAKFQGEGRPVVWHVYPGAYHVFDDPAIGTGGIKVRGHTYRYDPGAASDAHVRVQEFLREYLR